MNNKELIEKFYKSFAAHNADEMVSCYADNVVFEDGAFGELSGDRAKNMWRMLISRGKESLSIDYSDIHADHDKGSAHWQAKYNYGPSKRPVINEVDATFEFKDGKITKHVDHFDVWKWSKMALGMPGLLLGWSPIIKNKIKKEANKSLDRFISKQS